MNLCSSVDHIQTRALNHVCNAHANHCLLYFFRALQPSFGFVMPPCVYACANRTERRVPTSPKRRPPRTLMSDVSLFICFAGSYPFDDRLRIVSRYRPVYADEFDGLLCPRGPW